MPTGLSKSPSDGPESIDQNQAPESLAASLARLADAVDALAHVAYVALQTIAKHDEEDEATRVLGKQSFGGPVGGSRG